MLNKALILSFYTRLGERAVDIDIYTLAAKDGLARLNYKLCIE